MMRLRSEKNRRIYNARDKQLEKMEQDKVNQVLSFNTLRIYVILLAHSRKGFRNGMVGRAKVIFYPLQISSSKLYVI